MKTKKITKARVKEVGISSAILSTVAFGTTLVLTRNLKAASEMAGVTLIANTALELATNSRYSIINIGY